MLTSVNLQLNYAACKIEPNIMIYHNLLYLFFFFRFYLKKKTVGPAFIGNFFGSVGLREPQNFFLFGLIILYYLHFHKILNTIKGRPP